MIGYSEKSLLHKRLGSTFVHNLGSSGIYPKTTTPRVLKDPAVNMQRVYPYARLDSSLTELRLLTLAPGEWDDPINCTIHHDFLDDKPPYEALSYVWGDASMTREIQLFGNPMTVTKNLEIALRHIRREMPRVLWIDAICINQQDLLERSEQVVKMRAIYSSATTVLSWLGEQSEGSDEGMLLIKELGTLARNSIGAISAGNMTPDYLDQQGFDLENRNWNALLNLLDREYWTRTWIAQEIAAPGDFEDEERSIVGCGRIWVSCQMFYWICLLFRNVAFSRNHFVSATSSETYEKEPMRTQNLRSNSNAAGRTMMRIVDLSRTGERMYNIMRMITGLHATDPRDKIYGILGLVNENDAKLVSPDYSKPVEWVYEDVMMSIISKDGSLECLRANPTCENDLGSSWATIQHVRQSPGLSVPWANSKGFYCASKGIKANANFDHNSRVLHCSGIFLGEIKAAVGPAKDKASAAPIHDYVRKLALQKRQDTWRMIVMDQDSTDSENLIFPAPSEFDLQFAVLMEDHPVPDTFEAEMPSVLRNFRFSKSFKLSYNVALFHRCVFTTDLGYMGLGPFLSQPGDVVAILMGGNFPFVLRPKDEGFTLVGDAYVQGVMRGELAESDGNGEFVNGRHFMLC